MLCCTGLQSLQQDDIAPFAWPEPERDQPALYRQPSTLMDWLQDFAPDQTSSEEPWQEAPSDYDDSPMAAPESSNAAQV